MGTGSIRQESIHTTVAVLRPLSLAILVMFAVVLVFLLSVGVSVFGRAVVAPLTGGFFCFFTT